MYDCYIAECSKAAATSPCPNTAPNPWPHPSMHRELVPNSTENSSASRATRDTEATLAESAEFLSNGDDKKPPRFTDFEGKTSFGMSVFNLGNAIMGSGILGLAYAMANTGIVMFLFLLTAVAFLSAYSIHLLLKASGVVGIRAYEQLGFRAFGTPGKMAAGIAITLQNIGAMSSYLYIVKYEFPLVIQAFLKVDTPSGEWYLNGNYLVVIVSVCVILPLALMKQLGYLGYTSGFSLSCMVFFLISVIYKKFQVPCPFTDFSFTNRTAALNISGVLIEHNGVSMTPEDDPSCTPRMFNLNIQTAYTIPILAFAFVCHPEVLPIYTELRNPTKKKMQHVSNISITVMYVMYFLAALFGYLTFYDKVEAELLHTYSKIDPYDTLILCVRVAVLTAVTLTVPIVLFPVRRAIQQLFFPNKTFWWPRHIAIAILLLTIINLLVIFAPNILGIFGVIGATSAPCLIFIFPAVFYIRIVPKEEEPMRSAPKILAACFAGVGVLFMIMSLSFIIIDWTSGSTKSNSGH
ncbi:sodium-coupled neutral amino acid transporter 3a isoform X1 [Ictalurus furcatus]|uniref:sodium-coupled neutral amino acid transporter 3a isoform X1 n=1 Tax=Ictalurus furcatus TaxID=66913 RepID=UPI002350F4FA|nr:sodium-coupled neutral amino acid transporter 3a isoform X1 [Ictalurus furcatus]XP_053508647.1 sodium-coupled neutral amino acid transporter 3a isoform X1 [Ictalurus furcatus]XP_053508648.1 sodium-coupled neutral amino acid transporter 3a isoform X1 [Ictalurus furcatus]XP_053508649.1 sodium-coupled neutral amino acid transporter 3a isoform X1 [Ictalurus furcatus]XP_053508651.1 sodium-coupled neutral amino acid transporter 3a isoform X1 [Ictalurus furcatus]